LSEVRAGEAARLSGREGKKNEHADTGRFENDKMSLGANYGGAKKQQTEDLVKKKSRLHMAP